MKIQSKFLYVIIFGLVAIVIWQTFNNQKQQKQEHQDNFLFTKHTECQNICKALYEKDLEELSEASVLNPRYGYNSDENACFYAGGWIDEDFLTRRVVNCQTNEEMLTFMTLNGEVTTTDCPECITDIDTYSKLEDDYLGN